jgi:hypothetical protein
VVDGNNWRTSVARIVKFGVETGRGRMFSFCVALLSVSSERGDGVDIAGYLK